MYGPESPCSRTYHVNQSDGHVINEDTTHHFGFPHFDPSLIMADDNMESRTGGEHATFNAYHQSGFPASAALGAEIAYPGDPFTPASWMDSHNIGVAHENAYAAEFNPGDASDAFGTHFLDNATMDVMSTNSSSFLAEPMFAGRPSERAWTPTQVPRGSFPCPECPQTFRRACERNMHIKTHTRPYQCPDCSKGFAAARDRDRHRETQHRATVKYGCTFPECHYQNPRKDLLAKHFMATHSSVNTSPAPSKIATDYFHG